ncbi:hypothetical protein ACD591_05040 [Rufibacter glacialis]|uniref:TROVE domain-containing protein n=1 Tax=Rufibacter glacialis TaxID=1259555 RepID=A0A5M8QFA6_9BACT|nr:hypothetical protein [Rufibacter glacialis]KAA6434717.1 hypothetical protein FOE74_11100 [Rufibacter glacialis]GGK71856.1 hypothetical protein GCM10011405_20090 [Rufibacter glacialis]
MALTHRGDSLVSRALVQTLQRANEITELLAYYQFQNGLQGTNKLHRLSKQLLRGVPLAFNHIDANQFAKYNRAAEVKLRDALFLAHPKAKDAQQQRAFDQIATRLAAHALHLGNGVVGVGAAALPGWLLAETGVPTQLGKAH